ncbi:MAG TPA: outer membrane beta-barrel protein [Vicinamibacterales bacterium]|nr:outer membrane beta-barrel protein [Vicinamibacterales bacterium]
MTTSYWRWGVQCVLGVIAAAAILAPATAHAQITRVGTSADWRQAIGFNLGYFALKGEDGRGEDDVLFRNRDSLLFELKDFNGARIGAEWLVALGEYLEGGVGISFYQRSVPSIYARLVHPNGAEIEQDLKLRTVPIDATVRFLPVGRRGSVQPYVGAGIALINWRYTETGEFVGFSDEIFRASFEAKGNEVGPLILGGIRFAAGDVWLVGGEIRYQDAKGATGGISEGFLGEKIHLGGWTTNFTVHFRF